MEVVVRLCTLERVRELVIGAAGAPDSPEQFDSTATMAELGYESLAMIEVAVRISQEYGVALDEESLGQMTPREMVTEVNRRNGVTL